MKNPYGTLVPAPEGFAPPEAWPEYGASAMPKTICAREEVAGAVPGVRWGVWPIMFEEYISDEEPTLSNKNTGRLTYNRVVSWKRIGTQQRGSGWWQPSKKPWRIDGFHELTGGNYTEKWNKHARYDLRAWKELERSGRYTLERISFEAFFAAYRKSTVAKKIGTELVKVLGRKMLLPACQDHIVFFGVRNTETGDVVAGTALVHSPTFKSAIRECPFILPEARTVYASTALLDACFAESVRRGVQFLQFTHFRQPGDPRSWKGFSEFKSHFGVSLVAYPPLLFKFVAGKLF